MGTQRIPIPLSCLTRGFCSRPSNLGDQWRRPVHPGDPGAWRKGVLNVVSLRATSKCRIGISRRQLTPWLFMAPAIIILIGFSIYPMALGLKLSLYKWELASIGHEVFVGFNNYLKIFHDSRLMESVQFTLLYAAVAVSVELVLGTLLAVVLNQPIKGMPFFSTILLAPIALAPVAVGIAWRFFMNTEYGTMSYLLQLSGIAKDQVWLAQVATAKWVLIGIDVWWATPFVMLVVLAGLKSLPQEPFEASVIDGASAWQTFWHLTLPMLKPVFLVVLVFRTMDALRVYDLVYVLTFGGPGASTSSLSFLIYRTGFKFYEMGYATAIGMLFLVFIILVTLGFVRLLRTEMEL